MKKFFISLVFLFFFYTSSVTVFANTNFLSSCTAVYTLRENGVTHVSYTITLQSESAQVYAVAYALTVGFDDIENLLASDPQGTIVPVIQKEGGKQTIQLTFNKRVLDINKKLTFTIAFNTRSIMEKEGEIWEVNIPGIAGQNNFSDFSVQVVPSDALGNPSYVKPQPINGLHFTKEQLGASGVSLAFGTTQTYSFHLSYHIKNDKIFPITQTIALPSTTNYQRVALTKLSPAPLYVIQDTDGNWMAAYSLAPAQKIDIHADGTIVVGLAHNKESLSPEQRMLYTKAQPFWETTNEKIKTLGKKLQTPQAIYAYVIKTLHYDFSRVTTNKSRLGALAVLQNPSSAVCLEFTDLFIALSRAAGIPAREVDGFAYTQNKQQRPLSLIKDVLHAWPQYYDDKQQAWIMVDPTWGNTTGGIDYFNTLDFDHLAFAIRGQSSTYPIPAGGYKLSDGISQKDVMVSFASKVEDDTSIVSLKLLATTGFSGLPIGQTLIIYNKGSTLISGQTLHVSSSLLYPKNQSFAVAPIPPYGFIHIPLVFHSQSFLTNGEQTTTIQFAYLKVEKSFGVHPVFSNILFFLGGGIIVIFCIFVSIFAPKAWRLFFS